MRIDLRFENLQSVQAQKTAQERTAAAERSPERHDEARLSSGASNLTSLSAKAMAEPDVRADRVNSLRATISDGSYRVDPQKIADSMFRDLF